MKDSAQFFKPLPEITVNGISPERYPGGHNRRKNAPRLQELERVPHVGDVLRFFKWGIHHNTVKRAEIVRREFQKIRTLNREALQRDNVRHTLPDFNGRDVFGGGVCFLCDGFTDGTDTRRRFKNPESFRDIGRDISSKPKRITNARRRWKEAGTIGGPQCVLCALNLVFLPGDFFRLFVLFSAF